MHRDVGASTLADAGPREYADVKKNPIIVAAIAAALVLGLAGCGTSPTVASPSVSVGSAADVAVLETIAWATDASGVPTLTFKAPLAITAAASRLIKDGTGTDIKSGDVVTFDYVVTSATDGSSLYSTYDAAGTPEAVVLDSASLDPVFLAAFVGRKVGAQFIYATLTTDPTGATTDMVPIIIAVTVATSTAALARAEGTAVVPVDGLPVVTLAANGAPSVAVPATAPPADLVSQTLIQGTGAPVTEGQQLLVHYSGWLWDGTSFDSSWDKAAPVILTLSSDALIEGWVQGLAGVTVGSQVLLVVPPSLGYGDTASGAIPAGSTLVFVIDILAAP
jgi:FKBP-type peptidyl-prolyl cis-trans isomerase 2